MSAAVGDEPELINSRNVRAADTERETGGDAEASNSNVPEQGTQDEEKPRESKLKKIWAKLGLDLGTVMMMFKGSLAPIIAVAWYESLDIAKIFTTLGYLVPVITVLSLAIMPRAKYIQTLILNTLGICIGSAVALLGIWSGVQARKHTTPPGSPPAYNSSQSAVCAIWLFANIYFVNALRAKIPALQFPAIMYSIFTNVAFTFGPNFQTMKQGEALIRQLLIAFLSAFAISTAVSLFVVPVSSRTVVKKEQAGYVQAVRGALKAQTAYLQSLESSDMFAATDAEPDKKKKRAGKKSKSRPAETAEAKALKGAIEALTGLHGKLHGDMAFAKREYAWGKLDAKDLDEIFTLFRDIIIPLVGMSTITDIFERIAERRGWVEAQQNSFDRAESWEHSDEATKAGEKKVWNEVMKALHEPFAVVVEAMDEGMEHAGLVLEILPKPKKNKGDDVENVAGPRPGDATFARHLHQKVVDFYGKRGEALKAWARENGLSENQFDSKKSMPSGGDISTPNEGQHRRDQQQLYLILYMEHLLYSTGIAILNFVKFADKKVEDGTMAKKRLIVPGQRRIKKWILGLGRRDDTTTAGAEFPDSTEAGMNNVYMGSGFNKRKDPEHLPPQTAWQHFGNGLRTIPRFLGSPESSFGFRVACATLTIGIVAFLKDTHLFFVEQRLVWAMIIIAIGMNMTSGQAVFGFVGRIVGTFIAAISSLVIWYITDARTPGILVFLWFFIFLEMYFFLKFPRFVPIWLVTIVTQVLIIGYELQVRKIGIKAASASGQTFYPTYQLAFYRLACVAGGSFVAFIWTIFPYQLSDRSWLRKDLGSMLYLLANYYSVVNSTTKARIHNTEGDMESKKSPGRQLEKARQKIFGKLVMLLPSLQQHADWQKWELTVGGKFPRETYEDIILRSKNIMNYLSLISYATQTWSSKQKEGSVSLAPPASDPALRRAWLNDLSVLLKDISPTSHQITSTLSLLSFSVSQGSTLPPYIQLPQPYYLNRRLEALDSGILDARHMEEPGYSAYACLQVASSLITDDLARLVESVKELVGETDFSRPGNMCTDNQEGKEEAQRESAYIYED
ncbi:hypothetical protein V490_06378 [Pseudogymnoascus sp. VKM F-3557]|nr:hypothetical protein V490_06378 [Pseudogymnoascus sp. VKM F-3557]